MENLKTILLVDDDPITNFINKSLLEKLHIAEEIKVVLNGEEGIKCLEDHCFRTRTSPELILLDINMPVMDGFEFLRVFNSLDFKNKDEVIIAALTTSSHPEDQSKMKALGVTHFINKPLNKDKVKDFLQRLHKLPESLQ